MWVLFHIRAHIESCNISRTYFSFITSIDVKKNNESFTVCITKTQIGKLLIGNNVAVAVSSSQVFGPGQIRGPKSSLYINDTMFIKNHGVLHATDGSYVFMKSCIFSKNFDSFAIYIKDNSYLFMTNCTLERNILNGSIISIRYNSTASIVNSNFTSNQVDLVSPVSVFTNSSLFLNNCSFENNIGQLGGVILVINSTIRVTDSIFDGNTVENTSKIRTGPKGSSNFTKYEHDVPYFSQLRGYKPNGGAIYGTIFSALEILNSIFKNNHASDSGGAIFIKFSSHLDLNNCHFYNNTARSSSGAVGLYMNSSMNANNTEFFKNSAFTIGAIKNAVGSKITVDRCNFTGNFANYGLGITDIAVIERSTTIMTNSFISDTDSQRVSFIQVQNVSTMELSNCTFHILYVTRGGKISKKGQNWSMELLKKNHLDNITSMNKGP